jgi:hypothetical protein
LKQRASTSGAVSRSRTIAFNYIRLAKKKLTESDGMLRKTFYDIADYVLERRN